MGSIVKSGGFGPLINMPSLVVFEVLPPFVVVALFVGLFPDSISFALLIGILAGYFSFADMGLYDLFTISREYFGGIEQGQARFGRVFFKMAAIGGCTTFSALLALTIKAASNR